MSHTFFSHSFGCRVNQAEKEALDAELMGLGYRFEAEKPDVYIINTCAVTEKAEREARQLIYQIRRKYPGIKIVVTGCAATNWVKRGVKVPGIDYIVDNKNKEYIASLISKQISQPFHAQVEQPQKPTDKYIQSGRMIIKIQDGCHRFCSFCIVPYLRGLPKSVPIDHIISMIQDAGNGLKEAILTAINTEAYGYDTKVPFTELLTAVIEKTAVPRVSFGSIHPWSFQEPLFSTYEKLILSGRIVNFFHIPLQSGSNKILGLMKRGYTREEFLEKLTRLSAMQPFTFIGTDIIAGYLEETDADFADTYDFLERAPIQKFHIFRFSKRQHTAAFYMAKRLHEPTPEEKLKRAKALSELNARKYDTFLRSHVGHTFEALILEKGTEGFQHALLSNQIPVLVNINAARAGELVPVKVVRYIKNNIIAEVE